VPTLALAAAGTPLSPAAAAKAAERAAAQAELQRTTAELGSQMAAYVSIGHDLERTRQDVSEATTQLAEANVALEEARSALASRAVELYRGDQVGMLVTLLSARSLQDLFVRANYLALVTSHDARLLSDLRLSQSEAAWLQQGLSDRLVLLEQLQAEADRQRLQIVGSMAAQQARATALGADLARLLAATPAASSGGAPTGGTPSSAFNPDVVISDANFRGSASMSAADVQAFLQTQPGTLKSYRGPDHAGQVHSAAEMIAEAAVAFNISPKVILATLQKEQSLLSDAHPSQEAYNWAMGAGKADTHTYYQFMGFGNQIWWGAQKQDKNARDWTAGSTQKIDGNIVHPANEGTFAQYRYTPHLGGVTSFWMLYWRYFGDPLA
jgi:hypothetical protein